MPAMRLAPASRALGLSGFSALVLAWHWWRIRRNPAPFHDTSPLSFALSVALPLALYLTWWYAIAFSVTSDAALLFVGSSMMLAALRGYAGCEMLALSRGGERAVFHAVWNGGVREIRSPPQWSRGGQRQGTCCVSGAGVRSIAPNARNITFCASVTPFIPLISSRS